MRLGLLTSLAAMFGTSAVGQTYQTMRPVTRKNIGRNRLKSVSRYMPHQGEQECARRLRQWAKIETRRVAQ